MSSDINKFAWIDALRGYAVLLVMMVHSSQPFYGDLNYGLTHSGLYGVQLFFIASSYTLFRSYEKRSSIDGRNTRLFFFIRRLFRIAPLYWLAIITYAIAGNMYDSMWLPMAPFEFTKVLANFILLNGVYLPALNYIPPGGWSIGDEMLFYITLPILFSFITNLRKAALLVFCAMIASLILQVALYHYISGYTSYSWMAVRNWVLYLWFPNQFPVFCLGILFFHILKKGTHSYKEWMLWATIIGYFLLGFVKFDLSYPYFMAQPEYLYALILFAFAFCISQTKSKFMIYPINKLGVVSFSVYLIHFFVVEAGFWLSLNIHGLILNDELHFALIFAFTLCVSYLLARVTYKHVERRGIALGELLIDKITKGQLMRQNLKSRLDPEISNELTKS